MPILDASVVYKGVNCICRWCIYRWWV